MFDRKWIYELLSPENAGLVLIDYEPQMVFGVESMNRAVLLNNLSGICKTAKLFDIPTVLTTVRADSFSGKMVPEVTEVSQIFLFMTELLLIRGKMRQRERQ